MAAVKQIRGRKSIFRSDIKKRLRKFSRSGAIKCRQDHVALFSKLLKDLAVLNRLPLSLSSIKVEVWQGLIDLWRKKGCVEGTIVNRLSIIRKYVPELTLRNADFGIKLKKPARIPVTAIISPSEMQEELLIDVCFLQLHLGLKRYEAMRFVVSSMMEEGRALIPGFVAHNRKTRVVPVKNTEIFNQIQLIGARYPDGIALREVECKKIGAQIIDGLEQKGIQRSKYNSEYFRHQYILNRYAEFSKKEACNTTDSLSMIRLEVGFARNEHVLEIIKGGGGNV